MSTIRFEFRKLADGDGMIRLIYQVRGIRNFYSTKQRVYPENWEGEKIQRAKYVPKHTDKNGNTIGGRMTSNDVKEVNANLEALIGKIDRIEKKFEALEKKYTPEMVLKELEVDKKQDRSSELYDFIDEYIERNNNTRAKGSLTVYRTLKEHLKRFEKSTNTTVTFSNIDYTFFEAFQNFLTKPFSKETAKGKQKEVRLNNITIAKQLSTLKTFLTYAMKSGIEVNLKYKLFTIERDSIEDVIYLTQSEFDKLYALNLSKNPVWDAVRDAFCLSCLTGLRYSDLKQLKPIHIKKDFIDLTTVKTSLKVKIPIIPQSRSILNKWNNKIPITSNQRMNEHLKRIFEWNAIATEPEEVVRYFGAKAVMTEQPKYKLIGMHSGRKTFATLSLQKGMSAEQVMKIGGWKSYSSFKRYVKITEDHARAAMIEAYTNPSSKLKAV